MPDPIEGSGSLEQAPQSISGWSRERQHIDGWSRNKQHLEGTAVVQNPAISGGVRIAGRRTKPRRRITSYIPGVPAKIVGVGSLAQRPQMMTGEAFAEQFSAEEIKAFIQYLVDDSPVDWEITAK